MNTYSERKEYFKQYYADNKDRITKLHREWKLANPDKVRAHAKAGYRRDPAKCIRIVMESANRHRDRVRLYSKYFRSTNAGRYDKLRGNARAKGRELAISLNQYVEVVSKPCVYCGCENQTKGLDRIDNCLGYTIANVASCCWRCNNGKGMRTKEDFIDMCIRVADRRKAGLV